MKKVTNLLVLVIFALALVFSCLNYKQGELEAKISSKGQDICFMHDSIPWDYGGGYVNLSGCYLQSGSGTEFWFSDTLTDRFLSFGENTDMVGALFNNNTRDSNIFVEVARAGKMYDSSQGKFRQIAIKLYFYTNNPKGCVVYLPESTNGKIRFTTVHSTTVKDTFMEEDLTKHDFMYANRDWGEPKWTASTGKKYYPTNIAIDWEFYWADDQGRASGTKVPNPKASVYVNDIDDGEASGDTPPEGIAISMSSGTYSPLMQCTTSSNSALHDLYKGTGYSAGASTPVGKYKKDLTSITMTGTKRKTHWSAEWTSKSIGPANGKKTYKEILYGRSNHPTGNCDFGTGGFAFECTGSTGFTMLYKCGHGWGCSIDGNDQKITYELQGTVPPGYTRAELTPAETYVSQGTYIPSNFSTSNYENVPGFTFSKWRTGSSSGAIYQGSTQTNGLEGLRSNLKLYGTYTRNYATVKGVKKWVGGKSGDTCTMQLMRSKNANLSNSEEVAGYTKTLSWSSSNVNFSQGSMPTVDDNDHKYWYYWWKEKTVSDGYKIDYSYPSYTQGTEYKESTTTITNTYTTVKPKVVKVWSDSIDTTNRPASLSLDMVQKVGSATTWSKVKSVTVNSSGSWSYEETMPAYRNGVATTYCYQEPSVPTGYNKTESVSGNTTTITNTLKTKTISVKKTWDDENDFDGLRPTSLNVQIKRGNDVVTTLTLSPSNSWAQSYVVSEYHNKVVATYTVNEDTIEHYNLVAGYGGLNPKSDGTGWDVELKNYHKVVRIDYNVKKIWDDNDDLEPGDTNNLDRVRPNSIKVQLYRNNVKYGTEVTITKDMGWEYTWSQLPMWLNRAKATWHVTEVTPTYYTGKVEHTKVIEAPADGKTQYNYDTITNTHVPVCQLTVSKKVPRSDVYAPFGTQSYMYHVTATLLDGSVREYYQMLTPKLNNSTGYYEASYTWEDLWGGKYVVKELPVDRFTNKTITGSGTASGTDTMTFNLSCNGVTSGSVLYTGKIKNYKDYTHTDSGSDSMR